MKVILVSIILIGLSFLGIGVSIFFRRNGKFPEHEIGHNKRMKEMGITCVKCGENKRWREALKKKQFKIKPSQLKVDLSALR